MTISPVKAKRNGFSFTFAYQERINCCVFTLREGRKTVARHEYAMIWPMNEAQFKLRAEYATTFFLGYVTGREVERNAQKQEV